MGVPGYAAAEADAEQAIAADPTLPDHVRRTLLTIIRTERVARRDSTHDTELQTSPQPRASSKTERDDQEAKTPGLSGVDQGSESDTRRQSDYDLAHRNVGTKSKRQLQRERDAQFGEESQVDSSEGE
jgi:hypothetical protein